MGRRRNVKHEPASKDKKEVLRVRALTPMAGEYFSAAPGDIVTFPVEEARRMIDSGAVEEIDTDVVKLRKIANDMGYEIVVKD